MDAFVLPLVNKRNVCGASIGCFYVLFLGCCGVIDDTGDADGGGDVGVTTLQINCQNEKLKC